MDGIEADRRPLCEFLSHQEPDYLFCVVRQWNWSNGTWLLRWIAEQPHCTRATAQLIFWGCEPEFYLPSEGTSESTDAEEFELAGLVLRHWHAGHYAADRQGLGERLLRSLAGAQTFRADDGTRYRPGQVGWFDPDNPVPKLASYRLTEAQCDPAALPWTVPDDLGELQRWRRPSWTAYDLVEGVPEEFVHLLD